MHVSEKEITEKALKLSTKARAQLLRRLAESLETDLEDEIDPEIDAAWKKEAERRLRDIRTGKVKTIPWSEARKQLMAIGARAKSKRRA